MIFPDLRPLGIGEILDRAVTLFVRRFAVLVLILALVAIPVAVCQYAAAPQMTQLLDDLQRAIAVPQGDTEDQRKLLAVLLAHNSLCPAGFAILVAAGVLNALSSTACIMAIAQAYGGGLPSVRDVYRAAVGRWFAQLVALVFYVVLAFVLFFAFLIAVALVAFSVGALATVWRTGATIAAVPLAIVGTLVLFAGVALLFFATQMTAVSIALEDANPIRGIAQGLRRTFGGPVFWRSARVAAAVFAISGVGQIVLLFVAGALGMATHLTALYPIVTVVGALVLNALVLSFIVIYSIDVRVRREGWDLALAAQEPAVLKRRA